MTVKKIGFALVLLPIFFLLQNDNQVIGFIKVNQMIKYAIAIYLLMAFGYLALRRFNLNSAKSALILFISGFVFLFFSPIYEFFWSVALKIRVVSFWVIFPILMLFLAMLIRKVLQVEKVSEKLATLLAVTMSVLLVSSIVTFYINNTRKHKDLNLIYPPKTISKNYIPQNNPDSSKPDIYFLLFDEYTNSQTLKKVWGYNNVGITDWLSQKGFYIVDSSRTNYNFTLFSLSSIFNLNYLDPSKGQDGTNEQNVIKASCSLSDNELFSILEKDNYAIHFLAPFQNRIEENNLGNYFDFLTDEQLYRQTILGNLENRFIWDIKGSRFYKPDAEKPYAELTEKLKLVKRTITEIKNTTDSNANRKPQFVYGHLMIAHIPHVFNQAGQVMTEKEVFGATPFQTYTAQVAYANQVIRDLVGYIHTHNKKNTIIIIEGDHGFRHFSPELMPVYSFPNFSAIYFPDKNYGLLNQHLSPVNLFRVVLGQYFGIQLPLLKDSSIEVKDE